MPRYLTAGTHPIIGYDKISDVAYEKINRPRLGIYVQYWAYDTKAECDNLIQWAKDVGITELYLYITRSFSTPFELMGYASSASSHLYAGRADGTYLFDYLTRNCRPLGIKTFAWSADFYWNNWGSTTYSFMNVRLGAAYHDLTSSGGQMVDFSQAATRTFIANFMRDFANYNPMCEGVTLDYIRADGTSTIHTAADITAMVGAVRAQLMDREVTAACVVTAYGEHSGPGGVCQRPRDWVDLGYLDALLPMSYNRIMGERLEITLTCDGRMGCEVLHGFWSMDDGSRNNDLACIIQMYQDHGTRNFYLFDWETDSWNRTTSKTLAQAINITSALQTLYPEMNAITSITVNQGTNVIIADTHATHTITWAQLGISGGETRAGYIKANAEAVVGHSLKPLIFNYASGILHMCCGDWYRGPG